MKKVISILLVMLMILPVMGVSAAERETLGDMNFEVPDCYELVANKGTIIGYTSSVYDYETVICTIVDNCGFEDIEDVSDFDAELLTMSLIGSDEVLTMGFAVGGKHIIGRSEADFSWEWETSNDGTKFFAGVVVFVGEFDDGYTGKMYINQYATVKDGKLYVLQNFGEAGDNDNEAFQNMVKNASFNKTEEEQEETTVDPSDDSIKILVDGERVYPDSEPVIINGRTLCPIRAVAEKLGYNVGWDNDKRMVTIKNSERQLEVIIGASQMGGMETLYGPNGLPTMKGFSVELDVPAQIINNRTYLPLRAVGEALDCAVDWDGTTRTVIIESEK